MKFETCTLWLVTVKIDNFLLSILHKMKCQLNRKGFVPVFINALVKYHCICTSNNCDWFDLSWLKLPKNQSNNSISLNSGNNMLISNVQDLYPSLKLHDLKVDCTCCIHTNLYFAYFYRDYHWVIGMKLFC